MTIEVHQSFDAAPEGPQDFTPDPIRIKPDLSFKRRLLKAGIHLAPIITLGLPVTLYLAHEFYISGGQQWKEQSDQIVGQYVPAEKATQCSPALIAYEVQDNDSLSLIVRKSGMIPTLFDMPQEVRDFASPFFDRLGFGLPDGPLPQYPPSFAYDYLYALNPGLRDRENGLLYPHNPDTTLYPDTMLLPQTPEVIDFIKEADQFPFPDAPQDMLSAAENIHPDFLKTLNDRAEQVLSGNTISLQSIKDACVVEIYKRDRELNVENIKEILAEYEVQYGEGSVVWYRNKYVMRPYMEKINRIVKAAGVEERIENDLLNYSIYKPVINQELPGVPSVGYPPFIIKAGNFNYPSSLTQGDLNPNDEFNSDFSHVLDYMYPLADNLPPHQAEIIRLGRELLVNSRYDNGYLNYHQDLRLPFLLRVLSTHSSWKEAYLMLMQASLSGNMGYIEERYYQNLPDALMAMTNTIAGTEWIDSLSDLFSPDEHANSTFDLYASYQSENWSEVLWWQDVNQMFTTAQEIARGEEQPSLSYDVLNPNEKDSNPFQVAFDQKVAASNFQ